MEAGAYANGLAIWHTPHEFTFDFFVSSQPPVEARNAEGELVIRAPHRQVARVRVPFDEPLLFHAVCEAAEAAGR